MNPPIRTGRPPRQSTEADFEAFADVSDRLLGFDEALTAHRIDGWLTALAAGPVRPPAEQWIDLLFGDTFDRTFADPPDRAQALATLQARLDILHDALDAEELLAQPDGLRLDPFFDEWTDEDRKRLVEGGLATEAEAASAQPGSLWAVGVLDGLDALAGLWQLPSENEDFDDTYAGIVDQVHALAAVPDDEGWRSFVETHYEGREPSRDDLLTNACFALQDLRLLLLDFGPKPQTRRVAPQPGRNDPCPCGSGKKFKKCHGAMA